MADMYVVDLKEDCRYGSLENHVIAAAGIGRDIVNVRGVYRDVHFWSSAYSPLAIQLSIGYGRERVARRVMVKSGMIDLIEFRAKHAELSRMFQKRAQRDSARAQAARLDEAVRADTKAKIEEFITKHKLGRSTGLRIEVSSDDPTLGNLSLLQLTISQIEEVIDVLNKTELLKHYLDKKPVNKAEY